ncbi:MAG: hypothetical protein R2710_19470 [Acidimicrobiales bacterium]
MRSSLVITAFMVTLGACGTVAEQDLVAGGPVQGSDDASAATTLSSLPVTTLPAIDSEAILAASGFHRCPADGPPPPGDIGEERGLELLHAAVEAGISRGGSPGGNGYLPAIDLMVLDEPSLTTLAGFADPDELCVDGVDPMTTWRPDLKHWRDRAGGGWARGPRPASMQSRA